jgi:peptide-methionine (S)-S-oxide reductase
MTARVGLGGGCHWCTEGVFQSLVGVKQVNQGWIASTGIHSKYSEAIEVVFDPAIISLAVLIEIHLYTHASTSNHTMREKYRSAIYTVNIRQYQEANEILTILRTDFEKTIVTQVLPLASFKINKEDLLEYFYKAPNKPFCERYIHPKLKVLLSRFNKHVDREKLERLAINLS